mmetsp:Transcript_14966/g.30246  ORF Transcript_14966/g.30246 Transcript_14966/m.30246 type:complete len:138 (+) Transcript_14966:570-983(+)
MKTAATIWRRTDLSFPSIDRHPFPPLVLPPPFAKPGWWMNEKKKEFFQGACVFLFKISCYVSLGADGETCSEDRESCLSTPHMIHFLSPRAIKPDQAGIDGWMDEVMGNDTDRKMFKRLGQRRDLSAVVCLSSHLSL